MDEQIRDLIEQRANIWNDAKAVLDRDSGEGLNAEDAEQFERMNDELSRLDLRIDELHNLNEANKRADAHREQYESIVHPDVRDAAEKAEKNAFAELMSGKRNHLDISLRGMGTHIDKKTFGYEVRDLISDSATAGGNTVPTLFRNELYEHLVERGAIRQTNVQVLSTESGADLQLPKVNSYGTAALVGEGTALAENDPTFGQITLGAWKYGELLELSHELANDNGVGIESFLARNFGIALGNVTGAAYVTGTGTNQPRGVMVAVAADAGTAVQVASATVETDNLLDLQFSVIPAYRNRGYWFMNDGTAKAIRKLKNGNDEYVWEPSFKVGTPSQLLGNPVVIDPNVAAIGSANESVAFGDFNGFIIRDVENIRIERSDDFAFSRDMIAFRAVLRTDSDLIDSNAIAVLDTD